jgi:hypothetical protein
MAKHRSDELAVVAEMAFVVEGKTLREIAEACHRTLPTVAKWCEEGDWKAKREKHILSSDGLASLLEQQLRNMALAAMAGERVLTGSEAQTILKLSRAVQELRGGAASLPQVFSCMNEFVLFLKGAAPDLAPKIEPHLEAFLMAKRKLCLRGGR